MESVGYLIKREHAYIAFLLFAIPVGFITAMLKSAKSKQHFLTIVGFVVILILCGQDTVYSLITILLNTILIKYGGGGNLPQLVFVSSFLCRFIFSGAYFLNLPRNENNLANGIQLILTLKVISIAYEIKEFRDNASRPNEETSINEKSSLRKRNHRTMPLLEEPTFYDIISYFYCVIGLTTGPFFRYRTYYDMLHIPYSTSCYVPSASHVGRKLLQVSFYIALSLTIDRFFPLSYLYTDEFCTETSFYFRQFYIIPIGLSTLLKFSLVWGFAECSYAAANLGVYPAYFKPKPGQGPSSFENTIVWKENDESLTSPEDWSFHCCENIDARTALFSLTYEECLLHWNRSVQWWLATYVYSSSFVPKKFKPIRHFAVSTICAVWHGFKAGYYFAFFCLPVVVFAEQAGARIIGKNLSGFGKNIYIFINWFVFKCIGMSTFMIAYHLSNYQDIMRYMKSVYFSLYVIAAFFIFANVVVHQMHFSKTILPQDVIRREKIE